MAAVAENEVSEAAEGDAGSWDGLDQYNWSRQWYAVGWCEDFPPGQPHKVTLFDTAYVVVRSTTGTPPIAFLDSCPHRLAALSEGRVTGDGRLQCAYHGWAFDASGAASVPQSDRPSSPRCASPIPCQERAGLLWVVPDVTCRMPEIEGVPPPAIPEEMLAPGFRVNKVVRDLPIDYTLLMENLVDFDHGLFAHAFPGFDLYGGSVRHPQRVTVTPADPLTARPFTLAMRTPAVAKVTARVGSRPATLPLGLSGVTPDATSTFVAPAHIATCRRDPATGATAFIVAFWVVPVGVGRTRLMLCNIGRLPFAIPRWTQQLITNRFLDEDTHLLATQQPAVLAAEFAAAAAGRRVNRRRLYAYASPGEAFLAAVGRFLDAAVPQQPKRYARLARSVPTDPPPEPEAFEALFPCPPREVTLDRYAQHTAICPSSQATVRHAQRLAVAAAAVAVGLLVKTAAAIAPTVAAGSAAAVWGAVLANAGWLAAALFAAAVANSALWLAGQFHFVFDAAARDRHLRKIAAVAPQAA